MYLSINAAEDAMRNEWTTVKGRRTDCVGDKALEGVNERRSDAQ